MEATSRRKRKGKRKERETPVNHPLSQVATSQVAQRSGDPQTSLVQDRKRNISHCRTMALDQDRSQLGPMMQGTCTQV
ncbi:unnamed protein product [Pleuronectes platessa]|uniref:Uncharacterized protein n=1 Tax=Pleuronectes platessa TaxID=8262 RepID=A0A9N7Y9M3_PLEPL|nr:unnamed protein product [Pleuronectes platessa]